MHAARHIYCQSVKEASNLLPYQDFPIHWLLYNVPSGHASIPLHVSSKVRCVIIQCRCVSKKFPLYGPIAEYRQHVLAPNSSLVYLGGIFGGDQLLYPQDPVALASSQTNERHARDTIQKYINDITTFYICQLAVQIMNYIFFDNELAS